jgi:hypothetical protein
MIAVLKFFGRSSRAVYAGGIAFIGAASAAITGDQGFSDLNTYQWLIIGGVTLAAFGGVWGWVNPKV